MTDQLIIGMLSGTSRDGVDAVLVNFNHNSMDILHALCTPYPPAIKLKLDQLLETGTAPTRAVAELLDENLAYFFARVAQDLVRETGLEMRDIFAIGSHGQNVWHKPLGENPVSIQLGRGDLIARNTSTIVVNNFRSTDVEAGGQGAPLAPLLHRVLFHSEKEDRAILNIGGIANLTILPAKGGVKGFDCGPGNCLMDGWTSRHLQKDYDDGGRWAAKGEVDSELLKHMLADPYFRLPSPKSTGLEYFSMSWLNQILGDTPPALVNVQSTLTELSARSAAISLAETGLPKRLLVCGGGVHNAYLMRRIAAALPDVVVESTSRFGVDPDWVEGLLFAWLARERLHGRTQDLKSITGASHAVSLGHIHKP